MSIEEKISNFLKEQRGIKDATISKIKTTRGENKDGINLLYVSASNFEKQLGINYSNNCTYYAFDQDGNYVGCVKVSVCNQIHPTQAEMEYWANKEYKNRGNITLLAQEVIREIFEEKVFDNLKVREGMPTSCIKSIMVVINPDNYASLAVAKKLGFDETGMLHISNYNNETHSSKTM